LQQVLFFLQAGVGEIAHDEAERGFLQCAGDADRMQKALLAFGGLGRAGILRQAIDDGRGDLDGVLHLALGEAGMGRDAFDGDSGAVGRKRLVLDMAGGLAAGGIRKSAPSFFRSALSTPRPISSSGVNRILMVPCLTCGLLIRKCAASMISARPALLWPRSSVVPSVVTMSLPTWSASAGCSAARMTCV